MKCFYHNADFDGKCSAMIVKSKYPECELWGINHGDKFPWDIIQKDETVFMVDFSLQPFSNMERLNKIAHLIWIDHHKTAIDGYWDSNDCFECFLSENDFSGCELTWKYIYPDTPIPRSVHYLGRYDVWDHKDQDVLYFQYGLRSLDSSIDNLVLWRELLSDNNVVVKEVLIRGSVVLDYVTIENREYSEKTYFECRAYGLDLVVVNKMLTGSKVLDSIWNPKRHDAIITFGYNGRLRKWVFGIYTEKDDIDVSKLAKRFGGGGHQKAAGFMLDDLSLIFNLGENNE